MNLHLVLQPDQWTGPAPAGRLDLQVNSIGDERDGWVEVAGWRHPPADPDPAPIRGVWVLAELLRRR